jgi:hypothetical protein
MSAPFATSAYNQRICFSMKRTFDNVMHPASGPSGRDMARCTLENARQAFEAIHPHE